MQRNARRRKQMAEKEVMDIEEAAEFLHISLSGLYNLWRKGEGPPSVRMGKRRVVLRSAALAWLEAKGETQFVEAS